MARLLYPPCGLVSALVKCHSEVQRQPYGRAHRPGLGGLSARRTIQEGTPPTTLNGPWNCLVGLGCLTAVTGGEGAWMLVVGLCGFSAFGAGYGGFSVGAWQKI